MPHAVLTTYRVCRRCTVRAAPGGKQLSRMGPTKDDGTPRLITGWEQTPGWVEWIEDAAIMGYIRAGVLRELQR